MTFIVYKCLKVRKWTKKSKFYTEKVKINNFTLPFKGKKGNFREFLEILSKTRKIDEKMKNINKIA